MHTVSVKKGYDLNLTGAPTPNLESLSRPAQVGFHPNKIPFIKPRLRVKEGETVQAGSPLIEDKRNPQITFPAPGSGKVSRIGFGPRRVITEIVIELDQAQSPARFPALPPDKLAATERPQLVAAILAGSLWSLFRELPFKDIPHPETIPPLIIVSLGSLAPFHPRPEVYLAGREDDFEYGIKILKKLTDRVLVAAPHGGIGNARIDKLTTHQVQGEYPADDPATVLYHIKTSARENRSWYINGPDLLTLAGFLHNGIYPVERVVAVGGPRSTNGRHVTTRAGVPLADLVGEMETAGLQLVAGGIFNGYSAGLDSFLGFYETALTLMPAGEPKAVLGFIRPGFQKPSHSRAFLSVFNKHPKVVECDMNGEDRSCINCGYCPRVCPVDILPQFTFKAVEADEIEEALALGLLDCVECGLCSFVCPAKIEITDILKKAKEAYAKEIA